MRNAAAFVGLLVCLFLLWYMVRDDLRRLGQQHSARGTIVRFHTVVEDRVNTYTAVVRFETATGPIEFTDDFSGTTLPRVGRSVTVRYPPGQPELARIPRPLFRLLAYGTTLALAVAMVAIMLGMLPEP